MRGALWMGMGVVVVLAGCGGGDWTEQPGYVPDGSSLSGGVAPGLLKKLCRGVDCSGHGVCVLESGLPTCTCDSGFVADGLSCLPATQACGDGVCAADEDCAACEADCGACLPACGDGACAADEDSVSCPGDCPAASPGAFRFSAEAAEVTEGAGFLDVVIERVGGAEGEVSVQWRTLAMEASFETDYGAFSWTTLVFADGVALRTERVTILDDGVSEGPERFEVRLGSPAGGAALDAPATLVVTILDDDAPASVVERPLYGHDPSRGASDPVVSPHGGRAFFIATNGSDSNPGTSEAAPWATFAKANRTVEPGDIVFVRGGVYYEYVVIGGTGGNANGYAIGTATAPITWRSYPGEWAILDGSQGTVITNLLRVYSVGFNVIQHFEVRGSRRAGLTLENANDNVFENLYLHGNNGSGQNGNASSRNVFRGCTSSDNIDDFSGGDTADGFGFTTGGNNAFFNCVADFNSDDGWDLWKSEESLIVDCVSSRNGRGPEGNGCGFKLGGGGGGANRVERAVAWGNRYRGFSENLAGRPNVVYDSTAYANAPNWEMNNLPHVLRNCISFAGRANDNFTAADHQFNSWNLGVADPLFLSTDPVSPEFLGLSANSPAIDAGVDVGSPFLGNAPDLGAYEAR